MRVKCINDNWKFAPGCEEAPLPVFNHNYNVIETKTLEGMESFILSELGDDYGYSTSHFATLPDTTADELEKDIVNLETA